MTLRTTLTAIVRAYPEQNRPARQSNPITGVFEPYDRLVVIDTETTTDDTLTMPGFEGKRWDGLRQSLLFGRALFMRHTGQRNYAPEREVVFYPDDLPDSGFVRLRTALEREQGTELIPQTEFLDLLYRYAVKTTQQSERVAIAGFNLAFDLSRIAVNVSTSRRNTSAFSLRFWEYTDDKGRKRSNAFRPNLQIEDAGDFKFYTWTRTRIKGEKGRFYTVRFQSNFLDCQTLLRALFNETPSLDGALAYMAKKTGEPLEQKTEVEGHGVITPEYVAYNRQDVHLTAKLVVWLLKEAAQHPVPDPAKLYSTASLSKAYMAAMGIEGPPALRIEGLRENQNQLTGYLLSTYYGARTEVVLRNVRVPVVYLDFLSMYPTVIINGGLWDMMRAEAIIARDATDDVQDFLQRVTLDDLFNPETWPELNAIVLFRPDDDIVPVRATFGDDSVNIGFPYATSEHALWYTLHDVVASKLLTGKTPRIERAIRIVPGEPRKGMKPITLFGVASIDPYRDNLFKVAIEERKQVKDGVGRYASLAKPVRDATQLTLKILANATYGYYVELNDKTIEPREYAIYSLNQTTTIKDWVEVPGRYFSPAIATFVTSAARLMLALLEKLVYSAGGQHVFCDTDSMAIVSTRERQTIALTSTGAILPDDNPFLDGFEAGMSKPVETPVTALSWGEVDAIIQRFETLNPYDKSKVPATVLKVEDINFEGGNPNGAQRQLYAYAISSKRHCLFTVDGKPVKVTLSALGSVINPDPGKYERRKETGESFVEQRANDLWTVFLRDGNIERVPHLNAPMVRQRVISTPHTMQYLKPLNKGCTYNESIKPFSFYLEASAYMGKKVTVIRAFERNPAQWLDRSWLVRDSGKPVRLFVGPDYDLDKKPTRKVIMAAYLPSKVEPTGRVVTFDDFFSTYMVHPEVKFCGIDGFPCDYVTTGLLFRRHVHITNVAYTGKEGKAIRRNEEWQRPIIAEYDVEVVPLTLPEYQGLNNPPLSDDQLDTLVRRILLDMPRTQLIQAVRLGKELVRRHLQADRFPPRYRELYHNAAIAHAVEQTKISGLGGVWMYITWRGLWDRVRPLLDIQADMRELYPDGETDTRARSKTLRILRGQKTDVATVINLLNRLEPIYQERIASRADLHPALRTVPELPIASALRGASFWHALANAAYWQSAEGRERYRIASNAFALLEELPDGSEVVETLTPDGWHWQVTGSTEETATALVSAKTDLFYHIHTLGRGPLDKRHVDRARHEARAILKADYALPDSTTLTRADRMLLERLASDNDEVVRKAIDKVRDKRLRGPATPRRQNRRARRSDGFISAAEADGAEQLRELRQRGHDAP